MDLTKILNNKIIICFREEKNIFLNLKRENPFLNFKLIDVEEVYERLSFVYDYKALAEIIRERKVSLKSARQIIECLRFVDDNNNFDNLLELKNELIKKELLVVKEFRKYILEQNEILLFNQQNNKELQGLLTKNNLKFKNLLPIDIGIQSREKPLLIKYKNRFEQFNAICNEICTLLTPEEGKEPVSLDDIVIRANYNDLSLYFNFFEDLYHLKFYYKSRKNLRIYSSVQNLLKELDKEKSFDIPYDLEDEKIKAVYDLIERFNIKSEDFDFSFAYNLLIELLETYPETEISKTGIMVTNKFDCTKRKYVYELDFDFDNYPKVYSDDGYYTDNQIEKLQMNPSYIKTRIDDDKKHLFINYLEETSKLSMVEYALSKEVFASTYVDSLDMKVEEYKTLKVMNKSLAASKLTYKLNESSFKHSKTGDEIKELFKDIYKKEEEYDYSFKPFKYDNLPFSQTSFSSIDRYYECPFKFYCDKVLKIGEFASSGAIDVGSFIHKILESVFDKNFDLDVAFENALNCTELKISENRKIFFRAKIKDYVKILCNLLKNRYSLGHYTNSYAETETKYECDGLTFTGKVDSILLSQNNNEKFLTIIDYKTGPKVFDPVSAKDGIGLQLPFYYLFLRQGLTKEGDQFVDKFKSIPIGGVFIQPLYLNSKDITDHNSLDASFINSKLKMAGAWETDVEYLNSIDSTINAQKPLCATFFQQEKSPVEKIVEIEKIAEDNIKKFIDETKNFNYEILPYKFISSSSEIDGCKYCSFRKVCYRDGFKFRNVEKGGKK